MKKIIFFLVLINLMTAVGFVSYLIMSEERYERLENMYKRLRKNKRVLCMQRQILI